MQIGYKTQGCGGNGAGANRTTQAPSPFRRPAHTSPIVIKTSTPNVICISTHTSLPNLLAVVHDVVGVNQRVPHNIIRVNPRKVGWEHLAGHPRLPLVERHEPVDIKFIRDAYL